MKIDEKIEKVDIPVIHCPFEYLHIGESGEAVHSEDSLSDASIFELNIHSDPTINSLDHWAYSNLDLFFKLGVPSDSYILVQAYNEEMREDEWCTHVLKVKYSEDLSENTSEKVTQFLDLNVNPIMYMNLTNLSQNIKLFWKTLNVDFVNHQLTSSSDINLPKIK